MALTIGLIIKLDIFDDNSEELDLLCVLEIPVPEKIVQDVALVYWVDSLLKLARTSHDVNQLIYIFHLKHLEHLETNRGS
jgi:hypothetical protein